MSATSNGSRATNGAADKQQLSSRAGSIPLAYPYPISLGQYMTPMGPIYVPNQCYPAYHHADTTAAISALASGPISPYGGPQVTLVPATAGGLSQYGASATSCCNGNNQSATSRGQTHGDISTCALGSAKSSSESHDESVGAASGDLRWLMNANLYNSAVRLRDTHNLLASSAGEFRRELLPVQPPLAELAASKHKKRDTQERRLEFQGRAGAAALRGHSARSRSMEQPSGANSNRDGNSPIFLESSSQVSHLEADKTRPLTELSHSQLSNSCSKINCQATRELLLKDSSLDGNSSRQENGTNNPAYRLGPVSPPPDLSKRLAFSLKSSSADTSLKNAAHPQTLPTYVQRSLDVSPTSRQPDQTGLDVARSQPDRRLSNGTAPLWPVLAAQNIDKPAVAQMNGISSGLLPPTGPSGSPEAQAADSAPPSTLARCMRCKEQLEGRHFVQCPSNLSHKLCLSCSKRYIETHQADSRKLDINLERALCSAEERCYLASNQTPWNHTNNEFEEPFQGRSQAAAPATAGTSSASQRAASKIVDLGDSFRNWRNQLRLDSSGGRSTNGAASKQSGSSSSGSSIPLAQFQGYPYANPLGQYMTPMGPMYVPNQCYPAYHHFGGSAMMSSLVGGALPPYGGQQVAPLLAAHNEAVHRLSGLSLGTNGTATCCNANQQHGDSSIAASGAEKASARVEESAYGAGGLRRMLSSGLHTSTARTSSAEHSHLVAGATGDRELRRESMVLQTVPEITAAKRKKRDLVGRNLELQERDAAGVNERPSQARSLEANGQSGNSQRDANSPIFLESTSGRPKARPSEPRAAKGRAADELKQSQAGENCLQSNCTWASCEQRASKQSAGLLISENSLDGNPSRDANSNDKSNNFTYRLSPLSPPPPERLAISVTKTLSNDSGSKNAADERTSPAASRPNLEVSPASPGAAPTGRQSAGSNEGARSQSGKPQSGATLQTNGASSSMLPPVGASRSPEPARAGFRAQAQVGASAPPPPIFSPLKCMSCKERLEDRHFVQCPSEISHKFCFACSKRSIELQQQENRLSNANHTRIFCPSGERCFLATEQTPWTFMNSEIETIFRESSRRSRATSGAQQRSAPAKSIEIDFIPKSSSSSSTHHQRHQKEALSSNGCGAGRMSNSAKKHKTHRLADSAESTTAASNR